jgi:tetratricopeptide (TPR) repeat protein
LKKIFLFLLIILLISGGKLFAQSPEEIFRQAGLNYENKKYEEAVSLYEALVKIDRVSPEVFYNLGNSYFKLKNIGRAIVNYERALRLVPRDRDVLFNLKLAMSLTVDKIDVPERGFFLRAALFFYDRLNINELTAVVSVFYLIAVILLIFSIFMPVLRQKIFYIDMGFAGLIIILGILLVSKIHNENFVKEGVIISGKADIKSGPGEDYLLQFSLHEGAKARVVKERQNWYEVTLSKDLRGWLPKDNVEII